MYIYISQNGSTRHVLQAVLFFLLFTIDKLQAQRHILLLRLISISLGPNGIPPPPCLPLCRKATTCCKVGNASCWWRADVQWRIILRLTWVCTRTLFTMRTAINLSSRADYNFLSQWAILDQSLPTEAFNLIICVHVNISQLRSVYTSVVGSESLCEKLVLLCAWKVFTVFKTADETWLHTVVRHQAVVCLW